MAERLAQMQVSEEDSKVQEGVRLLCSKFDSWGENAFRHTLFYEKSFVRPVLSVVQSMRCANTRSYGTDYGTEYFMRVCEHGISLPRLIIGRVRIASDTHGHAAARAYFSTCSRRRLE